MRDGPLLRRQCRCGRRCGRRTTRHLLPRLPRLPRLLRLLRLPQPAPIPHNAFQPNEQWLVRPCLLPPVVCLEDSRRLSFPLVGLACTPPLSWIPGVPGSRPSIISSSPDDVILILEHHERVARHNASNPRQGVLPITSGPSKANNHVLCNMTRPYSQQLVQDSIGPAPGRGTLSSGPAGATRHNGDHIRALAAMLNHHNQLSPLTRG